MRMAVAGGTGLVGRMVVEVARAAGHEVAVISRRDGVDLVTARGLDGALKGVDTVVDVSNSAGIRGATATRFFTTATGNLLRAGADAGVGHHLVLSIVGVDRVPSGYYAAKRRQEELVAAGPIPWTVLRATQFHEFPGQLLDQVRGPVVPVPRARSATVAAREVAEYLVELAGGPAAGFAAELAGPEVHELPELARRLVRALGQRRLVVPVRVPGRAGTVMAGGGLLPDGEARRGRATFDEWLVERMATS